MDPILLIDNEYENVSDLMEVIEGYAYKHRGGCCNLSEFLDYHETAEEAAQKMIQKMNSGERYSAIVMDNHLNDSIDGDDFLRVVRGSLVYIHDKYQRHAHINPFNFHSFQEVGRVAGRENKDLSFFLESVFGKNFDLYKRFVEHYSVKAKPETTILYCGNPNEADLAGLEDVFVVQKDGRGVLSEQQVLNELISAGVLSQECKCESLKTHYRFGEKAKTPAYNHTSHHLKARKRKYLFETRHGDEKI